MLKQNTFFYAATVFEEMAWSVIHFPLWWYSHGLLELISALKDFLENKERSLALFVWLKNIFTPMYGSHDFWGRLISFMMRLFQIFVRGLAMLFWLAASSLVVCFWLLLPFYVIYNIFWQLM